MDNNENLDKYKKYLNEEEEVIIPKEEEKITPPPSKKKSKVVPVVIVALIVLFCGAFTGAFLFKDEIKNVITPTTTVPPKPTNVITVTFPEGYTIYQMGMLLQEKGVCSKDDFYRAANSPVEGIEIANPEERAFLLEGYLFPDTYEFYHNEDPKSVIGRLLTTTTKKSRPKSSKKPQIWATQWTKCSPLHQLFKRNVISTLRNVKTFLLFFITV